MTARMITTICLITKARNALTKTDVDGHLVNEVVKSMEERIIK